MKFQSGPSCSKGGCRVFTYLTRDDSNLTRIYTPLLTRAHVFILLIITVTERMVDYTNMGVGDGRPKYLQKGKKRGRIGKNIGERSEPSGILGRGKGRGSLKTCL